MLTSQTTLFDLTMKTIDGDEQSLSEYKGKVVVVVNVASYCGFTYQYSMLERLYSKYKDRGLVILAFPSNDFGAQEPGTDAEIKEFCNKNYNITFPMFSKITVKGNSKHPLYEWLTSGGGNSSLSGEIKWNFEKFLIDKSGKVLARYKRDIEPTSEAFIADVEKALNQ
ncbi:MAG: glutathione peroxidase [Ignavibacteria bacterium]|nr:glutathione peroxidase [Ignavibacteria bacterium]